MEPTTGAGGGGATTGLGVGGAAAGGGVGGMMNREQIKKMSEADKEMELRANRAKALLAERHIGLKENQVSFELRLLRWLVVVDCLFIALLYAVSNQINITMLESIPIIINLGGPPPAKDAARNSNEQGRSLQRGEAGTSSRA